MTTAALALAMAASANIMAATPDPFAGAAVSLAYSACLMALCRKKDR